MNPGVHLQFLDSTCGKRARSTFPTLWPWSGSATPSQSPFTANEILGGRLSKSTIAMMTSPFENRRPKLLNLLLVENFAVPPYPHEFSSSPTTRHDSERTIQQLPNDKQTHRYTEQFDH